MSTLFPGALDSLTNPAAGDALNSVSVAHHSQHTNANDAIEAMQLVMFGLRLDLAASKVVPGATSFAFRNHADTADTLKILDSGGMTFTNQAAAAGSNAAGFSFVSGAGGAGSTSTANTGGNHTSTLGKGGDGTLRQGGVGGGFTFTAGAGGLGNSTQVGSAGASSGSGGAGGAVTFVTGSGAAGDGTGATQGAGGGGGLFSITAGSGANGANGGANTSRGGTGGGLTFTLGNGGNGSNNGAGSGNGGAGGTFTLTAGNGGTGTNSGGGTSSGGAGGGIILTTGNAGATTQKAQGGEFQVFLGTGNLVGNTQPALGNGRHGYFSVIGPTVTGSTGFPSAGYASGFYPQFTVNCNGIGVGTTAYKGSPINIAWIDTDPTYAVQCSLGTYPILNSDANVALQGLAGTMHIAGPGSATYTSGNGCGDYECHIFSTGTPTHAYMRGSYNAVHFEDSVTTDHVTFDATRPTAANGTKIYGTVGEVTHYGTGTMTDASSVYGSIVLGGNLNGFADGQITNGYIYRSNLQLIGNESIGGTGFARSVITNGGHYYAQTPTFSASTTGVISEIWGFKSDVQFNSYNHTSAIATDTFIAGGAKLTVGSQSFTAAGTATNYGLYITGNGGTASGGGTVNNYAIYSDSTAQSSFAGLIITKASATGGAGLRLPHGAAPTSPVDGDIWTTSAGGLFVRINGTTKTVTLT